MPGKRQRKKWRKAELEAALAVAEEAALQSRATSAELQAELESLRGVSAELMKTEAVVRTLQGAWDNIESRELEAHRRLTVLRRVFWMVAGTTVSILVFLIVWTIIEL